MKPKVCQTAAFKKAGSDLISLIDRTAILSREHEHNTRSMYINVSHKLKLQTPVYIFVMYFRMSDCIFFKFLNKIK